MSRVENLPNGGSIMRANKSHDKIFEVLKILWHKKKKVLMYVQIENDLLNYLFQTGFTK